MIVYLVTQNLIITCMCKCDHKTTNGKAIYWLLLNVKWIQICLKGWHWDVSMVWNLDCHRKCRKLKKKPCNGPSTNTTDKPLLIVGAVVVVIVSGWIYMCSHCLSRLKLCVRIPHRRGVLDTTLYDNVYQWIVNRSVVFSGYSGFLH